MLKALSWRRLVASRTLAARWIGTLCLISAAPAPADVISSRTQSVEPTAEAPTWVISGPIRYNRKQPIKLKCTTLNAHALEVEHTEIHRLKVKLMYDPLLFSGPVLLTTTFLGEGGSVLAEKTSIVSPELIAAGSINPGCKHPNAPVVRQDFYMPDSKWVQWGKVESDFPQMPELLKKIKSYEIRLSDAPADFKADAFVQKQAAAQTSP